MKITVDREVLEMAIKKLHMLLLPVPAKETTAIMLAKRVSAQATEVCGLLQEALAQPQQEPVALVHGWHDGEDIPPLHPHYSDPSEIDPPESVRPLVFGDTAPPAQQSPWCMKMNGCKTKCEDCPDEAPKQRKLLTVDCLGLALDLESQAKRVDSQTAQRAMLAAALGLRNIEAAHGIKETP